MLLIAGWLSIAIGSAGMGYRVQAASDATHTHPGTGVHVPVSLQCDYVPQ